MGAFDLLQFNEGPKIGPEDVRDLGLADIADAISLVLRHTDRNYVSTAAYLETVAAHAGDAWQAAASLPPPRFFEYDEPVLKPTTRDEAAAFADGVHGFLLGVRQHVNVFDDLWAWARAASMEEAARRSLHSWQDAAAAVPHLEEAFDLLRSWLRPAPSGWRRWARRR